MSEKIQITMEQQSNGRNSTNSTFTFFFADDNKNKMSFKSFI